MSPLKILGVACCAVAGWTIFGQPSSSSNVASQQILSINEAPDRIILGWSGPIQEPMNEHIIEALDRYKADPRRLVLILNSPGGSINHGRKVVVTMHAQNRRIDTFVQKNGVCASMCVPVYLAGTERTADPDALFMFHQVSFKSNANANTKKTQLSAFETATLSQAVKTIRAKATDDFFRTDIGIRGVNADWLSNMRQKITSRDVWITGQQLVDEGSGIVDKLIEHAAR